MYMMVPLYTSWHSNLFGCFFIHYIVCLEQLLGVCCSCRKMQRKVIIHNETEGGKCTEIHWALCSVVLNLTKFLKDSWHHISLVVIIYCLANNSEVDYDLLCCYVSLP